MDDFTIQLINNGFDGFILIDSEGKIANINNILSELSGYTEKELNGTPIATLLPEYSGDFNSSSIRVGEEQETELRCKDAKILQVRLKFSPYYSQSTGLSGFFTFIRNISEQREIERELRRSKAQLQAALESLPFDFWIMDEEGKTVVQNPVSKELWGDVRGKHPDEVTNNKKLVRKWNEVNRRAYSGEITEKEIEVRVKGQKRIFRNVVAPIRDDNRIIGILGTNIDITDYKETQKKLLNALRDKNVLLKEIHHRVKNNLQVIISILNMQEGYLKNSDDRDIIVDTKNRISSMALIHEQLYESTHYSRIDIEEFIRTLLHHLFYSFEIDNSRIRTLIDIEDFKIDINRGIPLGLLINELVSNSIRHGFPGGREGEIFIQLKKKDRRRHFLTVRDNGIGVGVNFDLKKKTTLGLELVEALVEQLKGEISFSTESGFEAQVIFNW